MNWLPRPCFDHDLGIGRKLALLLSGSIIFTALLLTTLLLLHSAWHTRQAEQAHAQALARVLIENSKAALTFGDAEAARATLAGARDVDGILELRLYDQRGQLLATYQPPPHPTSGVSLHWLPTRDTLSLAVEQDGEQIGGLELDLDQTRFWQELGQMMAVALLLTLLLAITAIIVSLRLSRSLTTPLIRLAGVVTRVAQQRDYRERVPQAGDDEIGQLINGFNHMLDEIESRDSALQIERTTLEQRVTERTARLLAAEQSLQRLNTSLQETIAAQVADLRDKDALLLAQSRHAAMGQMIGNIAHQWRQPLNALGLVLQNLQLDQQDGCLSEAQLSDSVARAMELISRMSGTIDDFRDFFKPNRQAEDFSVVDVTHKCIAMLAPGLEAHGIGLHVHIPEQLTLHGFPGDFSHLLLNLLTNAKEALLAHSRDKHDAVIQLTQTLLSPTAAAPALLRLCVSDNGGGIAEDDLPRIFDPYFTTKPQGTGIGLYMVRTIVEQHLHGRITVNNRENGSGGRGAEFILELPVSPTVAPCLEGCA